MNRMSDRGFTLIELIVFIIVGAIFIPLAFVAFTSAMKSASVPDYTVKARFYAEQKMEEVTRNPFSTISCPTPNPDTPETNYSRTCSINYVRYISATNTIEISATDDMPNYRIIKIEVTPPASPAYDVLTIVTKRPKATP
jgi:prepilin-type N-terminal cleavage/methylation domain-containing protein